MKDEKLFIEIPDEIEVRKEIKDILGKGLVPQQPKLKRNTLAVAAVLLITLFGLGFAFPVQASRIPIVGLVYSGLFDHFGLERIHEFTTVVSISHDIDGKLVTIEEIAFDGTHIHFIYTVESNEEVDLESWDWLRIDKPTIHVDRRNSINFGGWSTFRGFLQRISDDKFLYAGTISLQFFELIDIENGTFSFYFGGANFIVPLEKLENEIITVDKNIIYENYDITLEKIAISPFGFNIFLESNFISPFYRDRAINLTVYDNLGNRYSITTSGAQSKGDSTFWIHNYTLVGIIPEEATELILTLFVNYFEPSTEEEYHYAVVDSVELEPIIIQLP